MTLISATKTQENPAAKWNGVRIGRFDGKSFSYRPMYVGSGSVEYLCKCSSVGDNPYSFYESPKLPQCGTFYRNSGVYYVDWSASFDGRRDGYYCWRMRYSLGAPGSSSYAPVYVSPDSDDETETDVEETILTIESSTEAEKYAVPFDLDGTPNANSLGEFFETPLEVEYGRLRLTFRRRESKNPWSRALQFWGTINRTAIWGCSPATLKIESIVPTTELTTGGTKWTVAYTIVYRSLGWLTKRADCGYYARSGSTTYRILNADGSPKETPTLLNGSGGELASGATPVYRTFRTNAYADFSELDLPNPFASYN